ncbi:MAG: PaaI family thioesterase [Steroidobacteraceae bacterium]
MKPSKEQLNALSAANLPGHLGVLITLVGEREIRGEMAVRSQLMASNGFLHAGSVVAFADTCTGYGCATHLPDGAHSFTTIELKSNHLGTAREGTVECRATAVHLGRTTQVWDAVVTHRDSGRTLALFRCTQLVLYPKT